MSKTTYIMTLKRMMMTVLMMLITVSAMSAEQKIWLRYSSGGKAKISLDGKGLELDKDNKATVKDAAGLKVAVTATPDNDYTVSSVTAQLTTDAGNATRGADDASFLEVTKSGSEYIFTMPEADYNVVVNVNFTYESSRKGGDLSGITIKGGDISGTYYIASGGKAAANGNGYTYNSSSPENNFYLCPTEDWCYFASTDVNENDFTGTNNGQPFLTTYKCRSAAYHSGDASDAVWIIKKAPESEYYYIIQKSTGRYLVSNGQIRTTTNPDRIRVHLESFTNPAAQGDKVLFAIDISSQSTSTYTYIEISPKGITDETDGHDKDHDKADHTTHRWLTVNYGNYNYLTGRLGKGGGPTNYTNTSGIVCIYTKGDANGAFYLEDYNIKRPTISYDASGNIKITNNAASATVYYSKGENSDPKTSETSFTGTDETLTSFTDGDIIKAVAKVGDEYSNVATFRAVVHVGSSNQYLIQNLERTDFYMIPGDVKSGNTEVNTSSLFRPTMSWYFSDAGSLDGFQYYYIINGHTGEYLYNTGNNVYMKTSSDFDESDGYKFFMVQGYDADSNPDGFHIVPKAHISENTYCIYKDGWNSEGAIANSKANAMKGSTDARRPEHKHTRWNFVLPSTLDKTPPFTISDATTYITKFYKIYNVGSSAHYIVPPTGTNTNATVSNSTNATTMKSGTWYFEEAQAATVSDWCTYYYIRNAETGKYLYFTKDDTNYATGDSKACLEMRSTIEEDNEDCYMFTWAKTADANANYYIVPKKLKDVSQNTISTLQRANPIQSNITRTAGDYAWTFAEAALFCSNPVFEESGENIVISCIPGSAEIRYTTNGDDPKAEGVTYSVYSPTTPFSKSGKHIIRACAVVSDGATPTSNTASSDVVTFIKNPDITFVEGNEVPYAAGVAVEPTVSSVTITPEGGSTFTIDATEYDVAYSNNTDVGEATVTISDALPENNIIISGTSLFTITPKSLGNGSTAADGITITLTKTGENTYSVTVKNGTVTLKQYDANNPTEPYDYTVRGTPDESGYVATVEAKKEGDKYTGNYTGGAIAVYVKASFPTLTSETDGGSAAAYQATTNLATPPDLKACIVTGVDYNAGTVAVQELAYIPVGVPVLLVTEGNAPHNADFTATIYEVGEAGAADVSANKLRKSDGSVTANWGQYYIFTKGEFVLSMGDNKTIKEGKYYFENSLGASTRNLSIIHLSRGGTMAINGVVNQKEKALRSFVWYTIDGQKLNQKPTRKGIYIHNGHKIIIK